MDQTSIIRPVSGNEGTLPSPPSDQARARKRLRAATALVQASDWDRAEALIRRAQQLAPHDAAVLAAAAGLHLKIASALYVQASAMDPAVKVAKGVQKLANGDSELSRRLTDLAGRIDAAPVAPPARPPLHPAPWPNREVTWNNLDRVFRRYVLAETAPEPGLITPASRVLTMGSCFAENISRRLAMLGVKVHYQRIREELNTTFANERLVRWVVEGPSTPDGERMESDLGAGDRHALRESLEACHVYVFSLGVAPAAFDAEGRYVLIRDKAATTKPAPVTIRTTTPAENARNVLQIIQLLRTLNPAVQVFLTLSPVPLAGSAERKSAILADCVSKASLRLAIEEVMAAGVEGVRYWPSFEMAKWWGAHMVDRNPFAADDGESRHVSAWLVNDIMDLFVEYYGDDALNASRLASAGVG